MIDRFTNTANTDYPPAQTQEGNIHSQIDDEAIAEEADDDFMENGSDYNQYLDYIDEGFTDCS